MASIMVRSWSWAIILSWACCSSSRRIAKFFIGSSPLRLFRLGSDAWSRSSSVWCGRHSRLEFLGKPRFADEACSSRAEQEDPAPCVVDGNDVTAEHEVGPKGLGVHPDVWRERPGSFLDCVQEAMTVERSEEGTAQKRRGF